MPNSLFTSLVDDYVLNQDSSGNYKTALTKLARRIQKFDPNLSKCREFYCYAYLDPRVPGRYEYLLPSGKIVRFSHQPFYIGKGKGGRFRAHLSSNAVNHERSHKANRIREILKEGREPIIKQTKARVSEAKALAFEIDLISGIGRRNTNEGPLTNSATGGQGGSGQVPTKSQRNAISLAKKGIPLSESHKAALKAAREGWTEAERLRFKASYQAAVQRRSPKERKRIAEINRATHKGRVPSSETRAKQREAWANKSPKDIEAFVENLQAARAWYKPTATHRQRMSDSLRSRSPEEVKESCRRGWETRRLKAAAS